MRTSSEIAAVAASHVAFAKEHGNRRGSGCFVRPRSGDADVPAVEDRSTMETPDDCGFLERDPFA